MIKSNQSVQLVETLRRLNLAQQFRNLFVNTSPGQLRAAAKRDAEKGDALTRSNLHNVAPRGWDSISAGKGVA